MFTASAVNFQHTEAYIDFQNSFQRFTSTLATQAVAAEEPCFTTQERRAINMEDPNALHAIIHAPLGGRSVDQLRKLISDIKRIFNDRHLPSSQGLGEEAIVEILHSLAAPGSAPSALLIWNAVRQDLVNRHGTGPGLLMIIRILDWIAFKRLEDMLPTHSREAATANQADLPETAEDQAGLPETAEDQADLPETAFATELEQLAYQEPVLLPSAVLASPCSSLPLPQLASPEPDLLASAVSDSTNQLDYESSIDPFVSEDDSEATTTADHATPTEKLAAVEPTPSSEPTKRILPRGQLKNTKAVMKN
jgi:hypothetical protein